MDRRDFMPVPADFAKACAREVVIAVAWTDDLPVRSLTISLSTVASGVLRVTVRPCNAACFCVICPVEYATEAGHPVTPTAMVPTRTA